MYTPGPVPPGYTTYLPVHACYPAPAASCPSCTRLPACLYGHLGWLRAPPSSQAFTLSGRPGIGPKDVPGKPGRPGSGPRDVPGRPGKPGIGPKDVPGRPGKPGIGPKDHPGKLRKPGIGPKDHPGKPGKPESGPKVTEYGVRVGKSENNGAKVTKSGRFRLGKPRFLLGPAFLPKNRVTFAQE